MNLKLGLVLAVGVLLLVSLVVVNAVQDNQETEAQGLSSCFGECSSDNFCRSSVCGAKIGQGCGCSR
jgi:hypothetical protein